MSDQPWSGRSSADLSPPGTTHPSRLPIERVEITRIDVPFDDVLSLVWKMTWASVIVGLVIAGLVGVVLGLWYFLGSAT